jgi:hypothetical protein
MKFPGVGDRSESRNPQAVEPRLQARWEEAGGRESPAEYLNRKNPSQVKMTMDSSQDELGLKLSALDLPGNSYAVRVTRRDTVPGGNPPVHLPLSEALQRASLPSLSPLGAGQREAGKPTLHGIKPVS